MERDYLFSASMYEQKYYLNPKYAILPKEVLKEIQIICVQMAEKIHGIFSIGFYDDGSIFFESTGQEYDVYYDEIGAKLEIERVKTEHKELVQSLRLWYRVFNELDDIEELSQ